MIIRINLKFQGSKGEKELNALFDSGASHSVISRKAVAGLGNPQKLLTPRRIVTARKTSHTNIDKIVTLDFLYENIRLDDNFFVIPDLTEDVIIGAYTMQKWHLKLDFRTNRVIVDPKVAVERLGKVFII